jgi:hypothetical protein
MNKKMSESEAILGGVSTLWILVNDTNADTDAFSTTLSTALLRNKQKEKL